MVTKQAIRSSVLQGNTVVHNFLKEQKFRNIPVSELRALDIKINYHYNVAMQNNNILTVCDVQNE